MKKIGSVALAAFTLVMLLGACGAATSEDNTQTIVAQNGSVQIDAPEGWSEDTSRALEGYLVLSISDGEGAFAQISYYPDDGSGDTAKDLASTLADEYYTDNIIGGVEETTVSGNDASYFEYSMTDEGADGSQYNYHGYEYLIGFGADIVEVDIYYAQGTVEGKLFSPSDDQLALLRSIAETARVTE
jgi:hypothetical protein